jgi:hypothetical protein
MSHILSFYSPNQVGMYSHFLVLICEFIPVRLFDINKGLGKTISRENHIKGKPYTGRLECT